MGKLYSKKKVMILSKIQYLNMCWFGQKVTKNSRKFDLKVN